MKTADVQSTFESYFDAEDENDNFYMNNIPKMTSAETKLMVDQLKRWVNLLRNHPFTLKEFSHFKLEITQSDVLNLVNWSASSLLDNFIWFDFFYDKINDPMTAFVAWMMIENVNDNHIPQPPLDQEGRSSVWDFVPQIE